MQYCLGIEINLFSESILLMRILLNDWCTWRMLPLSKLNLIFIYSFIDDTFHSLELKNLLKVYTVHTINMKC